MDGDAKLRVFAHERLDRAKHEARFDSVPGHVREAQLGDGGAQHPELEHATPFEGVLIGTLRGWGLRHRARPRPPRAFFAGPDVASVGFDYPRPALTQPPWETCRPEVGREVLHIDVVIDRDETVIHWRILPRGHLLATEFRSALATTTSVPNNWPQYHPLSRSRQGRRLDERVAQGH